MPQYEINAPHVVGEVIDGEAIVMDLKSGLYYSCLGTGAAIWSFMESSCTVEAIEEALAAHFPDSASAVSKDLADFVARLLEDKLIRHAAKGEPGQSPNVQLLAAIEHYAKPELQAYTDMQDLLLLDPVHEVDEAGWPEAKK